MESHDAEYRERGEVVPGRPDEFDMHEDDMRDERDYDDPADDDPDED